MTVMKIGGILDNSDDAIISMQPNHTFQRNSMQQTSVWCNSTKPMQSSKKTIWCNLIQPEMMNVPRGKMIPASWKLNQMPAIMMIGATLMLLMTMMTRGGR